MLRPAALPRPRLRALLALALPLAPAAAQPGPAANPPPAQLDRFEVTGSLIKQAEIEGPSPLRLITREEIDLSGLDNLTDIMRDIPEATSLGINEGGTTSFVRGASAIDLRFLGPNNTLVLVDGRRMAPNGISSGGTVFVDLNRIPVSSIERVEVLKDGASAVYGSDATAGVINIITRKDHVGLEVTARYGNYFNTDGAEQSYSVFGGTRAKGLRVNVNAAYTSRHANAAIDQPFSADADQTERWRAYDAQKYASSLRPTATATSAFDFRSGTGPYATVGVPTAAQLASNGLTLAAIRNPLTGQTAAFLPGTGGTPAGTLGSSANYASVPRGDNPARPGAAAFVPRAYPAGEFSNSYNFQPFVWNVPERRTRNLSVGLGWDLPWNLTLEASVMFGRIQAETRLAPSPASTAGDNDLLVPANNYYNPFGIPVAFTYRPLEVGPRIARITSDSQGYRVGLRGLAFRRFDWDLVWSYTRNESIDLTLNAISESKFRAALAKTTPDAFNIFGGPSFRNDPATVESIKVRTRKAGDADTTLLDGRVTTTELLSLPWGRVGAAAGLQHRREHFNSADDPLSTTLNDIIGQVRLADPTRAGRTVDAASAEVRVPLLRAGRLRWLHSADLSGAARFERFSDGYDSGLKPGTRLALRPVRSLLLRASYSETFRSPTLPQLYGGVREGLVSGLPDLRRPQALTGDPVDASTYQRLVKTAGNRNLQPENGITKQAGFVLDAPGRRLRGLSLEFTHGVIEQKNLITSGLGTTFIRQNELSSTGDLVVRDPQSETYTNTTSANISILAGPGGATRLVPPGQTVTVPGRIRFITDSAVNLSQQMIRYYDYGLRYRLRVDGVGNFLVSSSWTYNAFYATRRFQNDPIVPRPGRDLPRYRGQSSILWQNRSWGANLAMNYIHRHRSLRLDGWEVGRYYTVGGSVSYGFDRRSRLGDLRLTVGLENVFNKEPPLDYANVGYNQGLVGRPGGRFGYVAVRRSL